MAELLLDKAFLAELHKLEPPIRQKVIELPGKFEQAHHTGVHLEKLNGSADDRVRTVRVDQSWRGVVVRLGGGRFALLRVMPHDDANAWAMKQRFGVNPATGIIEITDVPTIAEQVEKATAQEQPGQPSAFENVADKDFRQVGVDEEFIPLLRKLTDEADVLAVSSLLPKAQGDAVLMLADGSSPDEVWAELAQDYLIAQEPVDTGDITAALKRPATRSEFAVTTNDEELKALLVSDFEAWRTFLHPAQRAIAEREKFNGPFRLTGGAGTGKTVVAMHRARFLAKKLIEAGNQTDRILVATYTTSLASNLERTLKSFCTPEEFQRIQIATVDAFAHRTLNAAGTALRPASQEELEAHAEQAVAMAALDEIGIDSRYLIGEWSQVIIGRDIRSLAEYATTSRPGRGRRLSRQERKRVWDGISRFTSLLQDHRIASYEQTASRAADHLAVSGESTYAHVIVDEAQDLHPAQWRLIRAAVRGKENDLFIVGDAHQRIYDNRVSLSSLGIETRGRSQRLKINYRTSQQILGWALGILTGEPIDDLDGHAERQVGYRSEFQGPPPAMERFDSPVEEAQYVADSVGEWLSSGVVASSIGVVARTKADLSGIKNAFDGAGMEWGEIGVGKSGGQVHVGTMHSSKGLEFARLFVVGVNADRVPLPLAVTSLNEDENQYWLDMQRERCLFYVACTRARDTLIVTSSGPPSDFIPDLTI